MSAPFTENENTLKDQNLEQNYDANSLEVDKHINYEFIYAKYTTQKLGSQIIHRISWNPHRNFPELQSDLFFVNLFSAI